MIRKISSQKDASLKSLVFFALILVMNLSYSCKNSTRLRHDILKFAWLLDDTTIEGVLNDSTMLNQSDITVKNHLNEVIPIKSISQIDSKLIVETTRPLDLTQNFILKVRADSAYTYPTMKLLNEKFYYPGQLGPIYKNNKLKLRVWSPTAVSISTIFYDKFNSGHRIAKRRMVRRDYGIWELNLGPRDLNLSTLHGYYYRLEVTAFGKTTLGLDPYAKSMASFNRYYDSNAKAAIIDLSLTNPPEFQNSLLKNTDIINDPMEFIGYEAHVRDFTIDPELDIPTELKGTYIGFTKIIPHLKDLGISHVQLQPIQSFYSIDDTNRTFQDEFVPTYAINYNWGYDPHHFFIPEGWFSTNPHDPVTKIYEFKSLVQSLHKNRIGVTIDVVYNHMPDVTIFEHIAPGCYFRRNHDGVISIDTGAGSTVESRVKMVRKMIIDSLKYFQDEYHVNGFRFDLMGFMDNETMKEIRKTLGDDSILYGEAWEFTDLPDHQATTKSNLPIGFMLGAFNDTSRDSYAGHEEGLGFIQGNYHLGPRARGGIIGSIKDYPTDYDEDGNPDAFLTEDSYDLFAHGPINTLNYLSIHDGFTLWDKINLSVKASKSDRIRLVKMAMAMLFTSQGRIVIHGGSEMGRSKPLALNDPESDRAITTEFVNEENGKTYFHGNSYSSPDVTNMIRWENKNEFIEIFEYVKGLIKLRKKINAFRYQDSSSIKNGLRFLFENPPEYTEPIDPPFDDFSKLDSLKLIFTNGVPNSRSYIAGEIHRIGATSNPEINPRFVDFDESGTATAIFHREEISRFQLSLWSDPDNLQIKLVNRPGLWAYRKGQYSRLGNNTIKVKTILDDGSVVINLAIKDYTTGLESDIEHNPYIAFSLNSSNLASPYSKIFTYYNANEKAISFEQQLPCDVLLDDQKARITPIDRQITLFDSKIRIPSKSAMVLGCHGHDGI